MEKLLNFILTRDLNTNYIISVEGGDIIVGTGKFIRKIYTETYLELTTVVYYEELTIEGITRTFVFAKELF